MNVFISMPFQDGVKLYEGLKEYFRFYNHERSHQSLAYKTPHPYTDKQLKRYEQMNRY